MIALMSDEEFPDFFARDDVQRYMEELEGIDRIDLLALKAQVLIEHRLRHLLALRMRAKPDAISKATRNTPAAALIDLVLCDDHLAWMRKELLMLNSARVAVAHGLAVDDHERHLLQFIHAKRGKDAPLEATQFAKAMWKVLYELELLEADVEDGVTDAKRSRLAKYAARRSRR